MLEIFGKHRIHEVLQKYNPREMEKTLCPLLM